MVFYIIINIFTGSFETIKYLLNFDFSNAKQLIIGSGLGLTKVELMTAFFYYNTTSNN